MSDAHSAALAVSEAITADVLGALRSRSRAAIVASAPAGGGKTHFVVALAGDAARAGFRVVVATPTNEQAREAIARLGALGPARLLHAQGKALAEPPAGVVQGATLEEIASGSGPVVTTVSKLAITLAAASKGDDADTAREAGAAARAGKVAAVGADLLILDEAFQVSAEAHLRVGDCADVQLLVGDPGQIEPFTSLGDVDWWRGREEDPLVSAVSALRARARVAAEHFFPMTRRLDERAATVARAFYPAMNFTAQEARGARSMHAPGHEHLGAEGWELVEVAGPGEAAIAAAIAAAAADLVGRAVTTDAREGERVLAAGRVIVGVARNSQRVAVLRALRAAGVDASTSKAGAGVRVLTANKAQGLECDVTLVWHPLADIVAPTAFDLDPGRLCVLSTRHRHGCMVFARAATAAMLAEPAPLGPVWPGHEDRLARGWGVHRTLLAHLGVHRVDQQPPMPALSRARASGAGGGDSSPTLPLVEANAPTLFDPEEGEPR